jgi:hypothetical protein
MDVVTTEARVATTKTTAAPDAATSYPESGSAGSCTQSKIRRVSIEGNTLPHCAKKKRRDERVQVPTFAAIGIYMVMGRNCPRAGVPAKSESQSMRWHKEIANHATQHQKMLPVFGDAAGYESCCLRLF